MKNEKGFTLTELLSVIVIIGIISMFAWPAVDKVVEDGKNSKYETYGKSMVAAAKVYTDAFEEDMFHYEEDLDDLRAVKGQCYIIQLEDLIDKSYVKDYTDGDMTCVSDGSFVKVLRVKGKYTYTPYLACGNRVDLVDGKLPDDKILFLSPELSQSQIDNGEHHYDNSNDNCNLLLSGYVITYDNNGGSGCTSKQVDFNPSGPIKWGELCVPYKKRFTFTKWYKAGTTQEVTADTVATEDIDVKAQWRKNRVYFIYKTTGGTFLPAHKAGMTVDGEIIKLNGSETFHYVDYDATLSSAGLADYNNSTYINIGKLGYHAVNGKEWKVETIKRYDQRAKEWKTVRPIQNEYSHTTVYDAADFCDATEGDCRVYLAPNWDTTKNKIFVRQNSNGGALKATHGAGISIETGGNVKVSNSKIYNNKYYVTSVTYGETMDGSGFWNWNHSDYINLQKTGYSITTDGYGEIWKTSDGSRIFDQYSRYAFDVLKPYVDDGCNPDYSNCFLTVYANWSLNIVKVVYHTNGGTFSTTNANLSESGGTIYLNGTNEAVHTFYYGQSMSDVTGTSGLADWDNSSFINIRRRGYHAADHAEWNTQANGNGKSFDDHVVYDTSELCDASNGDCTVHLYPKWVINHIYVHQNANGGVLATKNCTSNDCGTLTIGEGGNVRYNNSYNLRDVTYGGTITSSGFWNWDNEPWLNLTNPGKKCKDGAEWNTKPDGTGQSFNDYYEYTFNQLRPYCHVSGNVNQSCDPNYRNCHFTVYANWVNA